MKIQLIDLKAQQEHFDAESTIKKVVESCRFIGGDEVTLFEKKFAKFCDKKYCVGVASGTAAIHLALLAYSIGKGDEVITTPYTFIATVEPIIHVGATPVFVDIDPKDHTIDVKKIEKAITKRTKAIIPVHIFGYPCNMDPIIKIAKKHNLKIIEDACQAHGAKYKKKCIPVSETGIFSFFPAKNLGAMGDAGAVVTNNKKIAEKIAKLRDHGRTTKYEHDIIGFNYRLDAIQAAILRKKLESLRINNILRSLLALKYEEKLSGVVQVIECPKCEYSSPVFHLFVIKTDKRDELKAFLKEREIETGIHYPIPLHLQPALKFLGYKKGDFPISEDYADKVLSIPLYPELDNKADIVIEKILKFFKGE